MEIVAVAGSSWDKLVKSLLFRKMKLKARNPKGEHSPSTKGGRVMKQQKLNFFNTPTKKRAAAEMETNNNKKKQKMREDLENNNNEERERPRRSKCNKENLEVDNDIIDTKEKQKEPSY